MRILATFVAHVLLLGAIAVADDKEKDKDKGAEAKKAATVKLKVLVIRATTANSEISPELKSIADTLKSKFKYTGFKLEATRESETKIGDTYKTPLAGDYSAAIEARGKANDKADLKITVTRKDEKKEESVLNSAMKLDLGKYQLFGLGKLDKGDDLVIAVSAK